MADLHINDLRAAVAADIITEAQATSLRVIAEKRLGFRDNMTNEDEPFEFFKGFSEIFVTVGLGMLFVGILAMASVMGNFTAIPLIGAMLAFGMAFYFTLRRRMTLPSMWLTTVFAVGMGLFLGAILFDPMNVSETNLFLLAMVGFLAMIGWYRLFKLPFTMLLIGGYGLLLTFAIASLIEPSAFGAVRLWIDNPFDLNDASIFSFATLAFGIVAFLVGMRFDMQDPHRIGRKSAAGFWLHLVAAPALVNTIALSLFNIGGPVGYAFTALALALISLMALIVDRRSFLTAGIIYMAVLLGIVFSEGTNENMAIVFTLLTLGIFITVLGTWWGAIRAIIMRALPDFPMKDRLPPYNSALETE
jgi:hypothetical protein